MNPGNITASVNGRKFLNLKKRDEFTSLRRHRTEKVFPLNEPSCGCRAQGGAQTSFHTSCTYICILHTSCTKTLSPWMSSLLSHLCPNSQCLCWWVLDVSVYQLLWFLARHCRFHMKGIWWYLSDPDWLTLDRSLLTVCGWLTSTSSSVWFPLRPFNSRSLAKAKKESRFPW